MYDRQRFTRHDAFGHFGEAAIIAMQHKAWQNRTRPVNIAPHLDDHPSGRAGMPRPERIEKRLTGTSSGKQGDQFRHPVSPADEADAGARLGRPDGGAYPVGHFGIIAHMRGRTSIILRTRAMGIVIGRIADNMVKAACQHRWNVTNVGGQHPHPRRHTVILGIFLRQRGKVGVLFNSRDLNFRVTVRQTEADPANPGPQIENPARGCVDRRRQQHRISANTVAIDGLGDLDRLIQQMVMRDRHHLDVAVGVGLVWSGLVWSVCVFLSGHLAIWSCCGQLPIGQSSSGSIILRIRRHKIHRHPVADFRLPDEGVPAPQAAVETRLCQPQAQTYWRQTPRCGCQILTAAPGEMTGARRWSCGRS